MMRIILIDARLELVGKTHIILILAHTIVSIVVRPQTEVTFVECEVHVEDFILLFLLGNCHFWFIADGEWWGSCFIW